MKCVIFAGGKGSRIKLESDTTPKPLVTVGDMPIVWHIMKMYYHYGVKDFILCLGYKQEDFKKYFLDLMNQKKDISINFKNQELKVLNNNSEDWNITLVDTGLNTLTGGRLKRIEKYLDDDDDSFFLTYADAVSDIDIKDLYEFHKKQKTLATITVVKREERFGVVELEDTNVKYFREKFLKEDEWINGGFMVVNKEVLKYLTPDSASFEKEILEKLVEKKQLSAYKHLGFWQCMDFQSEREYLNKLVKANKAPWKVWED